jgi:hypothetical protein
MVAVLPFNYINTNNAFGAFTVQTDGAVQGTFMDNPSTRFQLRGGVVAYTETLPMWGGVGIYEFIPTDPPSTTAPTSHLGAIIGRATTLAYSVPSTKVLSGFSLFNQSYNAAVSTQSAVPMSASGMTFNYARLGSGMQIVVACDPSLISLDGGNVDQPVSWDFNNQVLQPYDASTATFAITSAVWASTNGGQLTIVMTVPSPVAGVGDLVNISGATNSGTGGAAVINTNFAVSAFTDNQHFVLAAPAAAGVFGTIGGSPVLNYGTGALNVHVDSILSGNSMVVNYNPIANFASWLYSGTVAIITI